MSTVISNDIRFIARVSAGAGLIVAAAIIIAPDAASFGASWPSWLAPVGLSIAGGMLITTNKLIPLAITILLPVAMHLLIFRSLVGR
jgi:hypothetical protein